jgi:hypothetical protein
MIKYISKFTFSALNNNNSKVIYEREIRSTLSKLERVIPQL